MNRLDRLEKKLEQIEISKAEDKTTREFKFNDRTFKSLSKKARKKPDYVLVQYLRNNRTVGFYLKRVISGNIIVVNNKGHELNPRDTWLRGKRIWYIIRERDTKPISVTDRINGTSTDDHPVLIKMVLGAIQKKEIGKDMKKVGVFIVIAVVLGLIGFAIFG